MFNIGKVKIENNVCIAPMAGITDLTYRLILKEFGAGLMTTELISAKGIYYDSKSKIKKENILLATDKKEKPIALQLFGSEPEIMLKAANLLYKDYDIIDINMGCPVKKVVNNNEGSALLKDVKTAYKIVNILVKNLGDKIPITCKIRIGFDNEHINAPEFAKAMEEAGASALTVHGRTRTEMYFGNCHRDIIKKVKDKVKIPVIANGNIWTVEDAKSMLTDTGADAIALGRAVKGNPWFVRECIEYINNNKKINRPTNEEIKNMMLRHIDENVKRRGEEQGINELKHHIAWYTIGLKNSKSLKQNINNIKDYLKLKEIINEFFENQ